ncbi:MAG TPA: hypothetical protein VNG73_03320 [Gemmatimonadaceae bacterium]|jgi:hypothetical protein|nr:hypothetical protein [Gemmatimonadaceae bacterium]
MSVKYLYLLAVAAVLGCASAGPNSGSSPNGVSGKSANYLPFDEIASAHADANTVYDAVARLRPNWLAPHGVTSGTASSTTEYATVFVDGQLYGDLNTLRSLEAYHVADIRYYDITQAGAKYGIRGGSSGVIDVRTK